MVACYVLTFLLSLAHCVSVHGSDYLVVELMCSVILVIAPGEDSSLSMITCLFMLD